MSGTLFPKGGPNPAGAYFTGQSYLSALSEAGVQIFNVIFEPGGRNFWHIHHAKSGGGREERPCVVVRANSGSVRAVKKLAL